MLDFSYYFSRFMRRFPWFLLVAVSVSAVAVIVALTLPPAYESEVKLIVETPKIPDELARSTVSTPAMEQLQIIEQRLMTRENLLATANKVPAIRNQKSLSPDEVVDAMLAQTTIRSRSGRNQATVMSITFEAPSGPAAAGVVNNYLSLILQQDAEFRTDRAVTTLEFFEQEVEKLAEDIDLKSAEILSFKNANAGALPETLNFRMTQQSRLEERLTRLESDISNLKNQRAQVVRLAEVSKQMEDLQKSPTTQGTARERRLSELQRQLEEALGTYSDESARVRQLRALIAQVEASVENERAVDTIDPATGQVVDNPLVGIRLEEIDTQIAGFEAQKVELEKAVSELEQNISKTPANVIELERLNRDYENIQFQYNTAVGRLSQATTGERIEFMSRGQRISVIEPPVAPTEPTKPARKKMAAAGVLAGILAGLGLVFFLEVINQTARRPEDIVARFEVMPIATIPYVHTRKQMVVDRGFKLLIILAIVIGIPALVYAVHEYYMPIDLVADKVMNRLGVRW